MINNFEEATLRELARQVRERFEAKEGFLKCLWCHWEYRKYDPIHNCILLDVIGLVESWEAEPALATG